MTALPEPDWDALGAHIIRRALQLEEGERVALLVDPYVHPGMLEGIRGAVLDAGGIDHAALLAWTPGLARRRDRTGRNPDPKRAVHEDEAMLDVLSTADAFIWLPADYYTTGSLTSGQSEWALARWDGRGIHFHWFPDAWSSRDSAVSQGLFRAYEHAILQCDQVALHRRQERLVERIRGRELHVTTPSGTDMRITLERDGWYHLNDGDASPEKARRATCARDREEELPAGAVRTRPIADSAEGVIRYRSAIGLSGRGVDLNPYVEDLTIVFRAGRLTSLDAGPKTAELRAKWDAQTGDKDRVSELVFGANELLPLTLPGARAPVYWGFGAGGFRFHLGDIVESGGSFASSFSAELWSVDATVTADGEAIIRDGHLLVD